LSKASGRRTLAVGIIPGLLLLVALAYLATGASRLAYTRDQVVHTFAVIALARISEVAIQDAERGQRGFLITGDPAYLAPYERGIAALPDAMGRLRTLIADNPEHQQRVARLDRLIPTKLDELKSAIEARRNQGFDAALAIVKTDLGRTTMEAITAELGAIQSTERAQLRDRLEAASRAEDRTILVAFAGIVAALAGIALVTYALYSAYQRSRRSEAVMRRTMDSIREGVSAFDADHRLVAWNQLFIDLLRLPKDFVRRDLSLGALQSFEATRGADAVAADLAVLDQRARQAGGPVAVERTRTDQSVLVVYHNPAPDGGFVTTYLDVTQQRQSEQIGRQAQKMEAIGQMTGGIAHDFNNLLTVVVGNLDRLQRRFAGDAEAMRFISLALLGADRGAKLTRQLLAFARRQPLEPRPVNLAQLLPDLTDLLRRTLGSHIEVEAVEARGLWTTSVDPTQFEAAVLNLAINARDAMPDGGKLTVELANVRLDEAYAARHAEVKAGQYVMLGVTDSGTGMSPEVAQRAFDPFFTTKGDDGTGLGLSMVYGFVKQSGGHVRIYSELGHGTTVKLYLPRTREGEAAPAAGSEFEDFSGTEIILVVEDDDTVRTTVVGLLTELGYRVIEAPNGASALTILESGQPIDLLFTDVIMPGSISSRVLAARAAELRPGIKILFTSGYTENTIVHNGRLDPGVQLISKPYGREQLGQKIRQIIGDGPGGSPPAEGAGENPT
jgi:signal transduction histidine kinase/CheY-like chemotaxis protein